MSSMNTKTMLGRSAAPTEVAAKLIAKYAAAKIFRV
jgi:hypothetical protein